MDQNTKYHPALYWENTENGISCRLCPHGCVLKEGKTGICRARINIDNSLYTMAYGNLCSLSIDPIEKKPLFHFLPSSKTLSLAIEGCTFRCLNCQNSYISQTSPSDFSELNLSPSEVVEMAVKNDCLSISYTYSEPVVFYEYMLDTAKLARQRGIKNVLVSNGYINPEPLLQLCSYIDAANIDLKSFDDEAYKKLTGGSLEPVKRALKILHENNVWLEITNLIIPGFTDNLSNIKEMSEWLTGNGFSDIPLHFSKFYPTYKLKNTEPTSYDILLKAKKTATGTGIKYVYLGNTRNENDEDTFCSECGKLLVVRKCFSVKINRIEKNKCPNCQELIKGVW